MNKEKLLYSLLKEISKNNYPTREEYEISLEEFGEIVELALNEGYIKGASVIRAGKGNLVQAVLLKGSRITLKGLTYLSEIVF